MPTPTRLLARVMPRRSRYPLSYSTSCCCQHRSRRETRNSSSNSSSNSSNSSNSSSSSNGSSDYDTHNSSRRRRALSTPPTSFYPARGPFPTASATATATTAATPTPVFNALAPSRPTTTPALPASPEASLFFSTATHTRQTAFPRHGKAVEPAIPEVALGATAAAPVADEEVEEEEATAPGTKELTGGKASVVAEADTGTAGNSDSSSGNGGSRESFPATPMPTTFSSIPVDDASPLASPALDAVTGGEAEEAAEAAATAAAAAAAAAAATESARVLPPPRPSVIELGPPTTGTGIGGEEQSAAAAAAAGADAAGATGAMPSAPNTNVRARTRVRSKALKPYVHHFDSYSLVKQLETGGYTQRQAITAMKAVRALLAQHLNVAQASLVSKSDVDNETYLFQAASAELRIEVRNNRRRADEQVRQQRALLQHEVDIAAQAIGQELVSLNDTVRGLFDDRKMAVREEQRALESKIQQLSYKIATDLNSEMRSEIEGMRWVMIWRAVLGILIMGLLTMVTLRYARYLNREKQVKAEAEKAAAIAAAAAAAAAAAEARAVDAGRPPDAGEVLALNR